MKKINLIRSMIGNDLHLAQLEKVNKEHTDDNFV